MQKTTFSPTRKRRVHLLHKIQSMLSARIAFVTLQFDGVEHCCFGFALAGPHPMSSLDFRVLIRVSSQWGFALARPLLACEYCLGFHKLYCCSSDRHFVLADIQVTCQRQPVWSLSLARCLHWLTGCGNACGKSRTQKSGAICGAFGAQELHGRLGGRCYCTGLR